MEIFFDTALQKNLKVALTTRFVLLSFATLEHPTGQHTLVACQTEVQRPIFIFFAVYPKS